MTPPAVVGAVDIGATKVLVGAGNTSGRLMPGRIRRIPTPDEPGQLVEAVVAAIGDVTAGSGALSALGCVAPGTLDLATGTMVKFHNRGWSDVPLGPLLRDRLGVPVFLQDDATAGALGEAVHGAGAGLDPVAYLTVSSGVGAGIVVAGTPLAGAHARAGEIGHLVVDPAGPPCGCGRNGDIESYAGGIALARRAAQRWPGRTLPDGTPVPRDAAAVFALAERGDPVAKDLVGAAAHALGYGVAVLATTVDPARIIVGGSVALSHPAWIAAIVAEARKLCWTDAGNRLDVHLAALGANSALAGAAVFGALGLRVGRASLRAARSCPRT